MVVWFFLRFCCKTGNFRSRFNTSTEDRPTRFRNRCSEIDFVNHVCWSAFINYDFTNAISFFRFFIKKKNWKFPIHNLTAQSHGIWKKSFEMTFVINIYQDASENDDFVQSVQFWFFLFSVQNVKFPIQ